MENLEINIQEFGFLSGLPQKKAAERFKDRCSALHINYTPRMRLPIKSLAAAKDSVKTLCEKAKDIRDNYFRRYEKRLKLLNDKKCIELQTWIGANAAVKVFLKPEDIETIEQNWKQKRSEFYSQQSMFGVEQKLFTPRKITPKPERRAANPN